MSIEEMLKLQLGKQQVEDKKRSRNVRSSAMVEDCLSDDAGASKKSHQRNPKCTTYHVNSKSIDTGNTSYVQVF